jgi:AraC-like DNA-binding protein
MKKILFDDFVPKIFSQVFRKCPPDWRVRHHFVDDNDITYIIEGKARYTINGTVHNLGPGDLLCLTDGTEKEAITFPHDLMHCFSVNFSSLYPGSQSSLPSFPLVSHIGLRQDLIELFRELTLSWTNQQEGYIVKARALLMLILHRLSEILIFNVDSKAGDYRINKATQAIALHYPDRLTVKGLASQVQLDEVYFGHLFKRETGMTVHQYIMRTRIRNAENMLQTGNYKVCDVADHCGFSDVVHFYKSFRALRGFPPSRCIPKDGGLDQ